MAGELKTGTTPGQAVYALIESAAGLVWNKTLVAFESFNAAHLDDYAVALTEQGAMGTYVGNFPTAIAVADDYTVFYFNQVGGARAQGDPLVGKDPLPWSGTALVKTSTISALAAAIKAVTDQFVFTVPGKVDATATAVIDPATIRAAVWEAPVRSLTQSAAQLQAILEGADITVLRGDIWTISLTGLGSLVGRTKLWFTVKASPNDSDDDSLLQIVEGVGLLRLNGSSYVAPSDASLVVDDADNGDITITVKAAATSQVDPVVHELYDVQMLDADGQPITRTAALFDVTGDVTRSIT